MTLSRNLYNHAPCDGPFKVLEGHFTLDIAGKNKVIPIDLLMTTYMDNIPSFFFFFQFIYSFFAGQVDCPCHHPQHWTVKCWKAGRPAIKQGHQNQRESWRRPVNMQDVNGQR